MRSFFRLLFRKKAPGIQAPPPNRIMSTSSISALLYAATVAAPSTVSPRPDDDYTKNKAHHVQHGFDNPWPSWGMHSTWTIVKGMSSRRWSKTANIPDTTPPTVPVREPSFLPAHEAPVEEKLRATWLGHACYYVEFPSGFRVLFDPVFQDRCSPFSFIGPKRYTEMPCQIKDIPTIDAVVISHNHYDHLSLPTVQEIHKLHPNCQFFVPLGNKKWFAASGIHTCTELDWWDEVDISLSLNQSRSAKSTSITTTSTTAEPTPPPSPPSNASKITARISCLPCQHISARTPFDKAHTLWSSWSVSSASAPTSTTPTPHPYSVYFAGDTGYRTVPKDSDGKDDWSESYAHLPHCPAFADIGRLRGPFDLGLIPIGAYMPRWIMSPMHANPRDAVEIFRDTKCKKALGMHWGTWVLTEEDVLEPPKLLKKALKHHEIAEEGVFDICDIGESREF